MSMSWLPNALTLLRCILAFAVAGAVLQGAAVSHAVNAALAEWVAASTPPPGDPAYPRLLAETGLVEMLTWPAIALGAFVLAALTDLFDGMAARAFHAQSAFGAWLDPIADKLLVGLSLVALTVAGASLWLAIPTAVILCRDVYVTWLRARLGGGYALPVMQAAKWKTALEMIAIGVLLAAPFLVFIYASEQRPTHLLNGPFILVSLGELLGTVILWIAAALSAWTGLRYLHAANSVSENLQNTFD